MKSLSVFFNLPSDYFKLPPSSAAADRQQPKKAEIIGYFILLLLLAVFSHRLKIYSEFGFDRLLVFFVVALPFYYLVNSRYRQPLLIFFFLFFINYALGMVSAGFYVLSSLFILFVIRSIKQFWMYLLLFIFITGLILLRLEILFFPRLIVAVPYVASAFMFRGLRFYYESRHGVLKSGFWTDLTYFFIPGNLCFLMFAVIDPVRFSVSFSGLPAVKQGLKRISLGFSLVLLYRFVQNVFPLSFEEIHSFSDLFHFAILKYLLILNITGILMCGIGTVGLTGFELPPLFGNFFLATSFGGLWRKINNYWREFILRIFYYPYFLRFRKWSTGARVFVSINIAFIISWLLHDYQLFWISGDLNLKATGFIYWFIFGNLVAIEVYREFTGTAKKERSLPAKAFLGASVFMIGAFLWLLWDCDTIGEFLFFLRTVFYPDNFSWFNLFGTLGILYLTYLIIFFVRPYLQLKPAGEGRLLLIVLPLFFLFLIVSSLQKLEGIMPVMKKFVSVFSEIQVSEEENFSRDQGYYENVITPANQNRDWPWAIRLKGEKSWGSTRGATRRTGDILFREFVPSTSTNMGYFTLKINSAGMRDKEYALEKKAGTFRIIILGGSNECGYGVEQENVFETRVENDLDSIYRGSGKKIELLDFAGLGNMLLQQLETERRKALPFQPDVVCYFAHPEEYKHVARNYARLILNGIDLKYDFLKEIKRESGASQSMSREELTLRILPFAERIIEWGYAEIVSDCRKNGVRPVWVFLPTPKDIDPAKNYSSLSAIAKAKGFIVMDLSSAYKGHKFQEIRVSETDFHPSILGHRLLEKKFLEEILRNSRVLDLPQQP